MIFEISEFGILTILKSGGDVRVTYRTVSSTWELTSVSMRYSQGDGVNTSLSRLVYCTHIYCIGELVFLSCMRMGTFLGTVMCYQGS